MRAALMCLVIGRLRNGDAGNVTPVADEEADSPARPTRLVSMGEPGPASLSLARRRRRNASIARMEPPEAAA